MRTSKIAALVAATALLVVGSAIAAFAATGWVEENGTWKYYDKYGSAVSQEWQKSGNDKYYLDENGEMATSTLVDDGTDLYYVDETGKMVKNAWEKITNTSDDDGDDYYWYYFQANGKAVKMDTLKLKSINGKKYTFDENGHMKYGWIQSGTTSKNDEDAWQDADYYGGGQDDGALIVSAWKQIEVIDNRDPDSDIDQNYWFYFQSNGQKVKAGSDTDLKQKTINGKGYVFDEAGVMKSSWNQAASTSTDAAVVASISSYYYFQKPEDGAKLKKAWFRVAPSKNVNATDNADDTAHWFYANGDGTLAKNEIKTIKSKKYLFNDKGEMVAGLVVLTADNKLDHVVETEAEMTAGSAAGAEDYRVAFFGDEETDGSLKTGSQKVSVDGTDYTILFNTSGANKGLAVNGLKSNYWYENGIKLCADSDIKVQAFPATFTGEGSATKLVAITGEALKQSVAAGHDFAGDAQKYVLLTNSGTIVKNATTKKDADGLKYTVANYVVTAATY